MEKPNDVYKTIIQISGSLVQNGFMYCGCTSTDVNSKGTCFLEIETFIRSWQFGIVLFCFVSQI